MLSSWSHSLVWFLLYMEVSSEAIWCGVKVVFSNGHFFPEYSLVASGLLSFQLWRNSLCDYGVNVTSNPSFTQNFVYHGSTLWSSLTQYYVWALGHSAKLCCDSGVPNKCLLSDNSWGLSGGGILQHSMVHGLLSVLEEIFWLVSLSAGLWC